MSQGLLPDTVEVVAGADTVTGRAGLPLVLETLRALGLDHAIAQHVQVRERQSGYREGEKIEAVVLLLAAGGDGLDDSAGCSRPMAGSAASGAGSSPRPMRCATASTPFTMRRSSPQRRRSGLPARWPTSRRRPPPSRGWRGSPRSWCTGWPPRAGARRRPWTTMPPSRRATSGRPCPTTRAGGATSRRRSSGSSRPWWWPTRSRDGNVPAGRENLPLIQRGVASLPPTVTEFAFRAESAC